MGKQRNPNGIGSYKLRKDGRYQWTQKKDGKPRQLTAKTLKELQEKVKRVSDLPVTSSKLTVDGWFEKWIEIYVKPLKKKATYEQHEYLYRVHISPIIGYRKIAGIKSHDIQTVIAKMNLKGLATETMKHAKGIMKRGFEKALDDKLIPENPVTKIQIPQVQPKPLRVLTVGELSKLFKAMENSRWIWSVKFLLVTGLRRGELLALKWTSVDFINKRLTINESNSKTGLGNTKSAKVHYVPLSDKAIEYLNRQKAMLEKEFNPALNDDKLNTADLVFPSIEGKMIRPDSYYTMLSRFAIKANIKANPHCFRHTFVYMTRESMDLKELQHVLGHDESTTTLDIYGDIISDSTAKTAAKIDDVFDKMNEEILRIETEKKAKKEMGKVIPLFKKAK